ncbi:MAG TPA: cupin domain-containing protein [Terriglobia bacterium]|nr:cupin domain-containing protein [Terriglobia bacterium]
MTFPERVDLLRAAESLTEYWSPKVVARVNDQYVKVAKLRGSFTWHSHADEDELFYILRGNLTMEYEGGRKVALPSGSLHVVPRGVLHHPVPEGECWVALVETVTTKHSGDRETPQTRSIDEQLQGFHYL